MTDSEEQREDHKSATAMLHIPVWTVVLGTLAVVFLFFILLLPNRKDQALFMQVGLTATQRWMDAAASQTLLAINEQGTATQAAKATKTPAPTTTQSPTPIPTETPMLKIGSTQISPVDNMTMLFVPAGSFLMGYKGGDNQNRPVHEVYLDNYWIDQTEISNGMYAQCVSTGKCSEPVSKESVIHQDYYGNPEYDDFPVVNMSWFQAIDYCNWAGRHLPTEAQWEKAARGDDGRLYPWGNIMEKTRGNFAPLINDFASIGSFPSGASPYGALQMAGNVYEWTADWYDGRYYQLQGEWDNPTGPAGGVMHSVRGGLFRIVLTSEHPEGHPYSRHSFWVSHNETVNYDPGNRMSLKPDLVNALVGFRCAVTVP